MRIDTLLNQNSLKNFLRNPLGVIALFVTICYFIAGLVFSVGLDKLSGTTERLPFIWFVIIFPVIIFVGFIYLVCFHHTKLYGPGDFKNEANFVELTKEERKTKYMKEAAESSVDEEQTPMNIENSAELIKNENSNIRALAYSAENSAHLAIQKLNAIYNTKFNEEVRDNRSVYDAIGIIDGNLYVVECKYVRNHVTINHLRNTYQQILRYRESMSRQDPQMVIVYVLEKYTAEVSAKIQNYYKSIESGLKIFVFDYNELKTQYKSIEEL